MPMAARHETVMIGTAGKVKEVEMSANARAGEFRPAVAANWSSGDDCGVTRNHGHGLPGDA